MCLLREQQEKIRFQMLERTSQDHAKNSPYFKVK